MQFSANLSGWINRCYSVHSFEGSFELLMGGFVNNLCSLDGIFGAWIFSQSQNRSGFNLIANNKSIHENDNKVLINSIQKHFKSLAEPYKIISRKFRKSELFIKSEFTQPDNILEAFLLPGFTINGKVILTIIAESEMAELLCSALPGMFQNILEYSMIRLESTDSVYRLLVENQNELVVKVDNHGRFLYVSPTYCKLFGMDAGQLIGRCYEPLIHPDDRQATANAIQQLELYPHTCYVEQRAETMMGWRWLAWSDKAILDKNGKIYAIIGVGRDITESKRVENELIESELKFHKAFRNSPNLMSISRLSDGLIYDVNDRFSAMLQLSRDEIIGKTTVQLGLFNEVPRSQLETILSQQGRIEDIAFAVTTRFNQKLEGLFSAEIIDLNGEKCLVSSFNDITELKIAQKELDNYRIHLEGLVEQRTVRIQEINEELDRFARSVSHDLKAPLRVMQGFANALIDDHSRNLDQEAIVYLQRINKATLQMETLINDLLQYSRLSNLDLALSSVNPATAMGKAIDTLSGEILKSNAIVNFEKDMPAVLSYLPVLTQVFTNLISNSLKFVKEGTRPEITIESHTENGKVFIRIKDNGIGIPLDKQKRIFDVFERLHGAESFPGTGIGLTIVKKAMERIGGRVTVISSPGEGSTFELELQSV
ncbi:MAG: PAS domain-containing sensor histidine kinase [Bacteroidota bacterium]